MLPGDFVFAVAQERELPVHFIRSQRVFVDHSIENNFVYRHLDTVSLINISYSFLK